MNVFYRQAKHPIIYAVTVSVLLLAAFLSITIFLGDHEKQKTAAEISTTGTTDKLAITEGVSSSVLVSAPTSTLASESEPVAVAPVILAKTTEKGEHTKTTETTNQADAASQAIAAGQIVADNQAIADDQAITTDQTVTSAPTIKASQTSIIEDNRTETTALPLPIIEAVTKPQWEPSDVTYQGNTLLKTYIVAQDTDLQLLAEEPFVHNDRLYTAQAIQKETVAGDRETKIVTQTIPVDVPTASIGEALMWYSQDLDYADEEGFSGIVYLNPETITVTPKGSQKYSYQVTDSKQFLNLDRNDPSIIPRTTVKSGRTLNLVNIDWQVADRMMAGDSLIATKYNATAHYAATAWGSKVTGYTATAVYTGEAGKQGADKYSCTVIYEGKLTGKGIAKRLLIPIVITISLLVIVCFCLMYKRHLDRAKRAAQFQEQPIGEEAIA